MKLSDEELRELHAKLHAHYGEPVLPIKKFCDAFRTWRSVMLVRSVSMPADEVPGFLRGQVPNDLERAIVKSNLLYRMLYLGEELRKEKCPKHNGVWSGIGPCYHGCSSTGWLPNVPQPKLDETVPASLMQFARIVFDGDEEKVFDWFCASDTSFAKHWGPYDAAVRGGDEGIAMVAAKLTQLQKEKEAAAAAETP